MSKDFDEDETLERIMAMSEEELDAELEKLAITLPDRINRYKLAARRGVLRALKGKPFDPVTTQEGDFVSDQSWLEEPSIITIEAITTSSYKVVKDYQPADQKEKTDE